LTVFDDKVKNDKFLLGLIGKAETTVSEILSLNKLSEDIRNIARGDKRFALRELKKIATKRHPEKQRELFEKSSLN
jgi:ParB family chromosome partitioning protein